MTPAAFWFLILITMRRMQVRKRLRIRMKSGKKRWKPWGKSAVWTELMPWQSVPAPTEEPMYGYFFRAQLMRPLRESLDLRCWKRELNLWIWNPLNIMTVCCRHRTISRTAENQGGLDWGIWLHCPCRDRLWRRATAHLSMRIGMHIRTSGVSCSAGRGFQKNLWRHVSRTGSQWIRLRRL